MGDVMRHPHSNDALPPERMEDGVGILGAMLATARKVPFFKINAM